MAKTSYITSSDNNFRLYIYQSDIQNSTAADPYVNVTVYFQINSSLTGHYISTGSWSASMLGSTYTASGASEYFDGDMWSGWKTLKTVFYQKGIWSVSKTRTSFSVSFSAPSFTWGYTTYSVSLSGTVTMQAWPVSGTKDTMSVTSSMTMGSSYTISITHKTSGNKNTLTWKFGSQSGTLLSKSTSTSVTFSPSTSLGAQIPSASSGTVTFTLSTYNSAGTSLGSSTYTSKLNVPSYSIAAPTVSAAKNSYTGIGVYVANKTQTRFTLSGLPSGSYGATVSGSYVIKLAGTQQTSGTKSGTSSSNVDYTAGGAGALQLTYTVKDSRGKSNSASASVTYVANAAPTISFSADRDSTTPTNWAGTATGTYLNVSGNTATVTFSTGTAGSATVGSGSFSRGVSGTGLSETSTLSVTATVTDSLGNTASKTKTIATVFAYMECTPNHVISLGRKADTSVSNRIQIGLDIYQTNDAKLYQYWGGVLRSYFEAGDAYFYDSEGTLRCHIDGPTLEQYSPASQNGVVRTRLAWGDIYTFNASGVQGFHVNSSGHIYALGSSKYMSNYVVSEGTYGGWQYRRWNNRFFECWYTIAPASRTFSAWGTAYYSPEIGAISYPTTFASVPYEYVSPTPGSAWVYLAGGDTAQTTSKSGGYRGMRPTSGAATFGIKIYVAGISASDG